MLDLDQARPAVPPRPASTVLVLRDDGGELGVYVIIRHPKSGFMGGVLAFPGGKVDEGDDDPSLAARTTALPARMATFGDGLPASPRALATAALRESLEEAALVPTEGDRLDGEDARALRARIESGASLAAELARLDMRLDLGALVPFARWITPVAEARRFDACFFLLPRPAGQEGEHDPHETTGGEWATPSALMARFARGELQIAPPTYRCLELLATCATVAEALALADRQDLRPICPALALAADGSTPMLVLPGDPLHPEPHVIVAGRSRFVLREGRFCSEDAS